ncbi:unnamed protein product [Prunus armeniaca]|uniref:Uncharacterized protein n=1 Tax=Prunus armeniaca TaxID=36596 RepID=A0A6J5XYG1_PRUAR|nr:unnamed protein product [Prunus armeniaca]
MGPLDLQQAILIDERRFDDESCGSRFFFVSMNLDWQHQHVHLSEVVVHLSANWDWTPPVPASNTPRVLITLHPSSNSLPLSRSTLE